MRGKPRKPSGKPPSDPTVPTREQFTSFLSNVPGIPYRCLFDKQWTMIHIYQNNEVERITGYPASDFINNAVRTFESIIHPDDSSMVEASIREAVAQGRPWEIEYRILHRDGQKRWVLERGRGIRNSAGGVEYLEGIILNITRRMNAEEGLRESESRFRALVDAVRDGIIFQDRNDRIIYCNRAAANVLGTAPETAVGLRIVEGAWNTIREDGTPLPSAELPSSVTLRTGRPCTGQIVGIRRGAENPMWLSVNTQPLFRPGEAVPYAVATSFSDITEHKSLSQDLESLVLERTRELQLANQALVSARIAAEAANRAKSTFLANMSHEIRTPMNAVIGMTDLVLGSALTDQQREYLLSVKDAGHALLSVINDILDFSKIEANKLTLENAVFDLHESLGDTIKAFALHAHQQGLELNFQIHPGVPRFVSGDYNRLRQIIMNLVGNALKFTPRGEVGLYVWMEGLSDDRVFLHFQVEDTGVGIEADKLQMIFAPFEQVDGSTTRRHSGTGLGLPISRALAEKMGGHLWVESEPGRGSRFHCTVCLGLAAQPESGPEEDFSSLQGLRVLAVDDNATNQRILNETLRSWKMVPSLAGSVSEALALLAENSRQGSPFRLVITDAHMPGEDGFELARRIRADDSAGSPVVMMLTSGDREEDVPRCRELGIAAYLLKPAKPSEILKAIRQALGLCTPPESGTPAAWPPDSPRSLKILLAEDSPLNQKLAVALLTRLGHTVALASDGRQAVDLSAGETFDLILMDLQMPVLDGLAATAEIRAREAGQGRRTPVIALTAHALVGDRQRCLQAGMDDYLSKPIHADELARKIQSLFQSPTPPPRLPPPA